jgi:hypothetical protein
VAAEAKVDRRHRRDLRFVGVAVTIKAIDLVDAGVTAVTEEDRLCRPFVPTHQCVRVERELGALLYGRAGATRWSGGCLEGIRREYDSSDAGQNYGENSPTCAHFLRILIDNVAQWGRG